MEKKIRTRGEVEAQIRAKNPHADNEVVEALTTLSLTGEAKKEIPRHTRGGSTEVR